MIDDVKSFTQEERAKVRTTIECTSYTKPLTPEEREQVLQRARRAMRSEDDGLEGLLDLQWDATLRAVEAERDAYKAVVDAVIANGTAEEAMLMHRRLSKNERSEFWTEYHDRIADALEALPEATP